MYWGKRHVTVGFFLLYLLFCLINPSFCHLVVNSAVLCHCLKAILHVRIYPNRASRRKLGKFGETMGREGALALFENLLITYLNIVRLVQVNDKNSDYPSFCFYINIHERLKKEKTFIFIIYRFFMGKVNGKVSNTLLHNQLSSGATSNIQADPDRISIRSQESLSLSGKLRQTSTTLLWCYAQSKTGLTIVIILW